MKTEMKSSGAAFLAQIILVLLHSILQVLSFHLYFQHIHPDRKFGLFSPGVSINWNVTCFDIGMLHIYPDYINEWNCYFETSSSVIGSCHDQKNAEIKVFFLLLLNIKLFSVGPKVYWSANKPMMTRGKNDS